MSSVLPRGQRSYCRGSFNAVLPWDARVRDGQGLITAWVIGFFALRSDVSGANALTFSGGIVVALERPSRSIASGHGVALSSFELISVKSTTPHQDGFAFATHRVATRRSAAQHMHPHRRTGLDQRPTAITLGLTISGGYSRQGHLAFVAASSPTGNVLSRLTSSRNSGHRRLIS